MAHMARVGIGAGVAAVGAAYWWQSRKPVVVVGGGVMGLSTAECMARAGRRVLLLDADHPIRGSWGVSRASHLRIEDPTLIKMGLFSIRHWNSLQARYAQYCDGGDEASLFYRRTGAMMAGPADAITKLGAAVQKELGDIPEAQKEILDPAEAKERFPQLKLSFGEKLIFMPEGYTMVVPTCLDALKWAADQAGVQRREDTVVEIDRVRKIILTEGGDRISYSELVLTAGPWTNKVLAAAGLAGVPMFVSNEQTVELLPKPEAPSYDWDAFPLFTWSEAGYKGRAKDGGCRYFYTTPHVPLASSGSQGVKIGFHRQGPLLDNDEFQLPENAKILKEMLPHIRKNLQSNQEYNVDAFSLENIQEFVREKMPGLDASRYDGYMRCLYQCTPDLKMIVGRHPQEPSIVFACGFSGSGFQFAPAIADYLVSLVANSRITAKDEASISRLRMHQSMATQFDPKRFD